MIKFLKLFCLALLAVSIIISTKWIIDAYFPGQEASNLSSESLQWISWYITAPLLGLIFILSGLEKWLEAEDK